MNASLSNIEAQFAIAMAGYDLAASLASLPAAARRVTAGPADLEATPVTH